MSFRYSLITLSALALLVLGCATSPPARTSAQAKPSTPGPVTPTSTPAPTPTTPAPTEPPLPRTVLPQASPQAPPPARTTLAPPTGPREERIAQPQPVPDQPPQNNPLRTANAPLEALGDIFFDFDLATLRPEAITILRKNLQWLEAHPTVAILLEGHCDERGSTEYNVALGQRRADAAGDYLVKAGLSPTRLHTMSYGKELPFAIGHDEAAWQLNRRAHFRLNEELPRHAFEFPAPPATGPPLPRRQPPP